MLRLAIDYLAFGTSVTCREYIMLSASASELGRGLVPHLSKIFSAT